jgi:hypothetical protein
VEEPSSALRGSRIIALAYQGFTTPCRKKELIWDPSVTRLNATLPLPLSLALIGGIAVLVLDRSSK